MARKPNPHFFQRQADGSVRLRLSLKPDEADIIEEGAGDTPLLQYIYRAVLSQAEVDAYTAREALQKTIRGVEHEHNRSAVRSPARSP